MRNFILFAFLSLSIGCSQKTDYRDSGFKTPEGLEHAVIVPTDSSATKIIIADEPKNVINASDLIEEAIYIPIETTSEALISFYRKVLIHDEKIYILDNLGAEEVFIYDINGNFLKKIGTKGGGPEDYVVLLGMCLDKRNGYLLIYDNGRRRIMYYDLEGKFIKKVDVPFRFKGEFGMTALNSIAMATTKSNTNFHLGDYDRFRIVYSDSLGNITGFGLEFDDNVNLGYLWSMMQFNGDELIFYENFTNSIYSVSDTLIREKYRIDCRNFTPFDMRMIPSFANNDEFNAYWRQKTHLAPDMAENSTHLYFVVNDKKEEYRYFYDKRSGNSVGFKKMNFDIDFFENFTSSIYIHNDYFIGRSSAFDLKKLKEDRNATGKPLSAKMSQMIDGLEEDDNAVLVLFKIKDL